MQLIKTINSITDQFVFSKIASLLTAEDELKDFFDTNKVEFDKLYLLNKSGRKEISPAYEYYLDDSSKISQSNINELAKLILAKFKDKWTRLYQNFIKEYDIFDTYDVNYEEHPNLKVETSSDADGGVYGFNSPTVVPASKSEANQTTETTGQTTSRRHGNTGIYTPSDIVRRDRELWKETYFEYLLKDVDSILTCPKYNI